MLWKEEKPESLNFCSNYFRFILLQITLKIGTDPESYHNIFAILNEENVRAKCTSGQPICLQ